MVNGNTIRQCAEIVEINIATAFFWRHKIIDAIRKFVGYGSLGGVIELDETYFALSYKGNHSKVLILLCQGKQESVAKK